MIQAGRTVNIAARIDLKKHIIDNFFKKTVQINHKKSPDLSIRAFLESGAGKETRTPDPNLGKVMLYQLSYSRGVCSVF
jgi:hypothetical protein